MYIIEELCFNTLQFICGQYAVSVNITLLRIVIFIFANALLFKFDVINSLIRFICILSAMI